MELLWPFVICFSMVSFFVVAGIAILWRYEGGGKLKDHHHHIPSSTSIVAGILPIGYLCREELWMACGGAVKAELLLAFRALVVAYLLPQLLYNVGHGGVSIFFFYTQWTFTLLILYISLALRVSVEHFLDQHCSDGDHHHHPMKPARIVPPARGEDQEMLALVEADEVEGLGTRSILHNGNKTCGEQEMLGLVEDDEVEGLGISSILHNGNKCGHQQEMRGLVVEDDEVEGQGIRSILHNGKNCGDRQGKEQLPFARRKGEKVEHAGIAGYVTQAVFQAVLPAVLLTDMVYWCLLVPLVLPKTTRHTFIDVNLHAINALLLLTEFTLNSLRFPWFRIGYVILWSASYTYFQWTLFTTGLSHKWPYPFMNVDTPWAPAWYFFIIVFHGICFALCILLALGKQSIWSRFNFPTIQRMTF